MVLADERGVTRIVMSQPYRVKLSLRILPGKLLRSQQRSTK